MNPNVQIQQAPDKGSLNPNGADEIIAIPGLTAQPSPALPQKLPSPKPPSALPQKLPSPKPPPDLPQRVASPKPPNPLPNIAPPALSARSRSSNSTISEARASPKLNAVASIIPGVHAEKKSPPTRSSNAVMRDHPKNQVTFHYKKKTTRKALAKKSKRNLNDFFPTLPVESPARKNALITRRIENYYPDNKALLDVQVKDKKGVRNFQCKEVTPQTSVVPYAIEKKSTEKSR